MSQESNNTNNTDLSLSNSNQVPQDNLTINLSGEVTHKPEDSQNELNSVEITVDNDLMEDNTSGDSYDAEQAFINKVAVYNTEAQAESPLVDSHEAAHNNDASQLMDTPAAHHYNNQSNNQINHQNTAKQPSDYNINSVTDIVITKGKCTNLPTECSKAQLGELQDMPTAGSRCSECNALLYQQTQTKTTNKKTFFKYLIIAALGVLALCFALLVIHFFKSQNTSPISSSEGMPDKLSQSEKLDTANLETKFNIQGSNTIGATLMPSLLNTYYTSKGDTPVKMHRHSLDEKTYIYQDSSDKQFAVDIHSHGSSTGIDAIIKNKTDIAMSSTRLSEEKTAQNNLQEKVIAVDGVAIIVHPSNTVESLTIEELRNIFSGKYTNWKAVGGSDQKINLYSRDEKSGTRDIFENKVLNQMPMSNAQVLEDHLLLSNAISLDKNGIGFVSLPYVQNNKSLSIAVDANTQGYKPTTSNITDGNYPISRPLYLYTNNKASDDVIDFTNFVLSSAAEPAIQQAGFAIASPVDKQSNTKSQVNVQGNANTEKANSTASNTTNDTDKNSDKANNPDIKASENSTGDKPTVAQTTHAQNTTASLSMASPSDNNVISESANYKKLSANAQRINANIYFNNNNSELNAQAKKDLAQVGNLLEEFRNKGQDKKLVLIGFADNHGDSCLNDNLSIDRARLIANKLQSQYNIKAEVATGMGSEAPVADNNTEAGRQKNRRVELWLADASTVSQIPTKKHVMCK